MKNIFLKGLLITGIAIVVLAALYYKESNKDLPLSEIFPEEHPYQADVEMVNQVQEKQTQPFLNEIKKVKAQKMTKSIPAAEPLKKLTQTTLVNSNPINSKSIPVAPVNTQKLYTVQVASLKDKSKAEEMIQGLKKKSLNAFLKAADLKDKGVVYRIYTGNFSTREKAEDFLQKYKQDFNNGFVVEIK